MSFGRLISEFFFGKEQSEYEQSLRNNSINGNERNGSSNENKGNNSNNANGNSNNIPHTAHTKSPNINGNTRSTRAVTIQVINGGPKIIQKKEENPPQPAERQSEVLRRKSMSYLQTVKEKEGEVKRREEEIKSIREQLSRLRPTGTKSPMTEDPTSTLPKSHSIKDQILEIKTVNNEELAIKLVTESMEACQVEIEQLNKRLASQNDEIEKLKRDLHGCRLRSRTYSAMVQRGAEIPEYSIFIEQSSAARNSS